MLKITPERLEGNGQRLRLEGRITGAWVHELQDHCERCLDDGGGLTLDLSGVSFVEGRGVELLRRLQHRNVAITGGSGFVTALLQPPGA